VVIEQEIDADGRPGAWRAMLLTVPVFVADGLSTSVSMRFDFPGNQGSDAADGQTWHELIAQMGISAQGENGYGSEEE
jgi:hypothetical protein